MLQLQWCTLQSASFQIPSKRKEWIKMMRSNEKMLAEMIAELFKASRLIFNWIIQQHKKTKFLLRNLVPYVKWTVPPKKFFSNAGSPNLSCCTLRVVMKKASRRRTKIQVVCRFGRQQKWASRIEWIKNNKRIATKWLKSSVGEVYSTGWPSFQNQSFVGVLYNLFLCTTLATE